MLLGSSSSGQQEEEVASPLPVPPPRARVRLRQTFWPGPTSGSRGQQGEVVEEAAGGATGGGFEAWRTPSWGRGR